MIRLNFWFVVGGIVNFRFKVQSYYYRVYEYSRASYRNIFSCGLYYHHHKSYHAMNIQLCRHFTVDYSSIIPNQLFVF